jgi:hypothetical protein
MRIPITLVATVVLLATIGCRTSTDDRLVEMAREHASRQAETQRQMTDLQRQVAEGSRQLVESDAKAREELTALQYDLRTDQAQLLRGHDLLEAERREIAAQRYRDPIVATIIMDVGIMLACLLPLSVCIYILWSAHRDGESDSAVAELLLQELVTAEPRLLLTGQSSLARPDPDVAGPPLEDGGDRGRPAD